MANNFLIAVGDSLTAGTTPGAAPYTNFLSLTNGTFDKSNIGVIGLALSTMAINAPFNVAPLSRRGVQNICVIWGGTNDIANNNQTAVQVFASLTSFCGAIRSLGWRVIVCTGISRTGSNTNGTNDAIMTTYNALIVAGWASIADGLANLAGNSQLIPNGSNFSNSSNYAADGIHLLASAQQNLVAPIISAAANAITTSAVVPQVKTTYGGVIGGAGSVAGSPIAVAAGDLVVVAVRWGAATTVTGVSDGVNTFVPLTTIANGSSVLIQFFYAKNAILNNADTITATFSGSTGANAIFIWTISGADITAPLDQQKGGTGSLALITSAAFTTVDSDEVIFTAAGCFSGNGTYTAQAGYTLDLGSGPGGSGQQYFGAQHKIVSSIQSGVTSSMTCSTGVAQAIAVATFKLNASISGSAGIAGATVSYSGTASGSVVADGSGNFTISNLEDGTYTITPTLAGYTFAPTSQAKTITNSGNVTGVNFTATKNVSSGGDTSFNFDYSFG